MSTVVSRPIPRARWTRVGVLLFLVYLFAYMDRTNISVAAIPMTKELGYSSVVMGVLLSSFFWGYVITQIPGGYVATRFRAKWVITVAMVIWAVFSGLTGAMHSLVALETVRFIMGLAEGVVWPSFMVLTSRWYPGAERARAVNLFESTLPFSSVVMAPLAGWMIAQWNWHVMFYLQAIPPLVMAILTALLLFDDPAQDPYISAEERDYLVALRQQDEERERAQGPRASVLSSFAIPQMWVLAIIYLLWISGLYAFGLWLPTVVKEMTHHGITAVGFISAIPFLVGLIVMYLNAWLSDRSGHRALYVIWPLIVGGAAFVIGRFIPLSDIVLNFIMLCIGCVGIYAPFGPWWSWGIEQVPHEHVGTMMGFINFAGNFGGIVGPIAVSLVAVGGSLYTGFYILGIAMMVGGFLAWLIKNSMKSTNPVMTPTALGK
ncbi:MAG: MFS transporter [Alicyclobacillus macrosporangiidus]|uniref:MFS transporter n=1 Tax=Alicyclobacillus macrosporangiidus TaxID=392015 RepID=UPI0026EEB976|nr:MFS transporter [Alicyclobacillus macrosporangiidus]MCL6597615.1 MFS transporter [Alicyclobacillus macrosporangiidus]